MNDRPEVLVIAPDAAEYAALLARANIPCTTCQTAAEARARYSDQAMVLGAPGLLAEVIADLPAVRWVQSTWAGVKPLLDAPRRDYLLTGVKGVFGPLMAEYVLGYLLAHELKILRRAAAQRQRRWLPELSGTLRGKRAGVMGTGSIGAHIAAVLQQRGMQVTGFSRSGRSAEPFDRVFAKARLADFLGTLDYLVLALPDTDETRGLLDAAALAQLPPQAVLVNVGRAPVIDHAALCAALRRERLAGAVLDVFETEPLPSESPLWDTPGLTLTAHISGHSHPCDIAPLFIDNYLRFIANKPLRHLVDFTRGY